MKGKFKVVLDKDREEYLNHRWRIEIYKAYDDKGRDTGLVKANVCFDMICIAGISVQDLKELINILNVFASNSKFYTH